MNMARNRTHTEHESGSPSRTARRIVIYARTSLDDGGVGVAQQVGSLRQYAAEHHMEIIGDYSDGGFGGSIHDRPGLNRLMAFVRDATNRAEAILMIDASRFTRDSMKARTWLHDLKEVGVEVVFSK